MSLSEKYLCFLVAVILVLYVNYNICYEELQIINVFDVKINVYLPPLHPFSSSEVNNTQGSK